jgi:hypothetical protein
LRKKYGIKCGAIGNRLGNTWERNLRNTLRTSLGAIGNLVGTIYGNMVGTPKSPKISKSKPSPHKEKRLSPPECMWRAFSLAA